MADLLLTNETGRHFAIYLRCMFLIQTFNPIQDSSPRGRLSDSDVYGSSHSYGYYYPVDPLVCIREDTSGILGGSLLSLVSDYLRWLPVHGCIARRSLRGTIFTGWQSHRSKPFAVLARVPCLLMGKKELKEQYSASRVSLRLFRCSFQLRVLYR